MATTPVSPSTYGNLDACTVYYGYQTMPVAATHSLVTESTAGDRQVIILGYHIVGDNATTPLEFKFRSTSTTPSSQVDLSGVMKATGVGLQGGVQSEDGVLCSEIPGAGIDIVTTAGTGAITFSYVLV